MALLLGILKTILIILLVIILVLLLTIVAVLFAPIRYRLKLDYDEMLAFDIRVSWLLHILGVKIYSTNNQQNMQFTLFGIPIWNKARSEEKKRLKAAKKKKAKVKAKQTKKKRTKASKTNVQDVHNESCVEKEEKAILHATSKEEYTDNSFSKDEHIKEDQIAEKASFFKRLKEKIILWIKCIKRFFDRILEMLKNIKYTFNQICDKIKVCIDNINYYKNLLQDRRVQKAFQKIKRWLSHFWNNIKPKKFHLNIAFGLEDPATVADILSIYSVLYPWIGRNVFVYPEYESVPVKVSLFMKGRVTVYWVAYAIWKYLFDKDIKYLWKQVVREED